MIVKGIRSAIQSKVGANIPVHVEDTEFNSPMPHIFLKRLDTDFHNTMDGPDVSDLINTEIEVKVRAATDIEASSLAETLALWFDTLSGGMGTRFVEAIEVRDFRTDPEEARHGMPRGRSVIVVPVIIFHRPS